MDLDYLQAKEDELKSRLEACLKHVSLLRCRLPPIVDDKAYCRCGVGRARA
jgi:hypothetical protein